MAEIRPYTSQVLAQGAINSTATPASFGVDMSGLERGVNALEQRYEAEDVTNVHVEMAKRRAEWAQRLQDMQNSATPGDKTFAPTLMSDMQKDFEQGATVARTARGQQVYRSLAANMTSEYGQAAIGFQARLNGEAAKNGFTNLADSLGRVAYQDPGQYESAKAQALAAIDDPNSIFAHIPAQARKELREKLERDVSEAAARGFVQRNPGALTGSLLPEQKRAFNPYVTQLKTTVVPGGQLSVSPKVLEYAEPVTAAAAAKGLNANILIAQIDQESRGNPNAVSPKGATGISQFMPATAQRFGIDPTDPQQSIKGQAQYMSLLLNQFGGDYTKALAAYNWGEGNLTKALQRWGNDWMSHAPAETQNYVASIVKKAGMVVSDQPPPVEDPAQKVAGQPVRTSKLPWLNSLTWEQQDKLINEDVRILHSQMAMDERIRLESERIKRDSQETVMNDYTQRIFDPAGSQKGAPTEIEVANDPTLTSQQKQHTIEIMHRQAREKDSAPNPTVVKSLMQQIHAADDDPTKTYNMQPINDAYRLGQINTSEYKFLRTEVEQLRDGGSNNFQRQVNQARMVAENSLTKSIIGAMQPELANEAAYRFNMDMQAKIEQYRKENKDPRSLLDPGSRDYLLRPERIMSFMPTGSQALKNQAGKAIEAAKGDRTPAAGFTVGQRYTINGKPMEYVGGPINLSTSWKS